MDHNEDYDSQQEALEEFLIAFMIKVKSVTATNPGVYRAFKEACR